MGLVDALFVVVMNWIGWCYLSELGAVLVMW